MSEAPLPPLPEDYARRMPYYGEETSLVSVGSDHAGREA